MTKTVSYPTFKIEQSCDFKLIAGVDEAGCGPLAGPVSAGAVIFLSHTLPESLHTLINDSKKLTPKKREIAFNKLSELNGTLLYFGVGLAQVHEIDHINIGKATRLAMERAVQVLPVQPDFALIDGIRKPNLSCPSMTVVKGDALSLSIAAASIFAKVTRDRLMQQLDIEFPNYGWASNAGYGSSKHIEAIHTHGITPHHRRSFEPIKSLVSPSK